MTQTDIAAKNISVVSIKEKKCLRFVFQGILTQKQAAQICGEWVSIMKADPLRRYNIIFNAMKMDNYEPMARTIFQKTIKELHQQIDKIWVVTDSKIISAGAAIMGVFTSFPIKSVSSEDDILV